MGKNQNALKFFVIVVDLALVILSYILAFLIRFSGRLPAYNTSPFIAATPLVALTFLIYMDIFGLLKFFRRSRRQTINAVLKIVVMQALTTTSIAYFMQGFSFPRSVLLISTGVQALLLTLWNWATATLQEKYRPASYAIIIGGERNAEAIKQKIAGLINTEKIKIIKTFGPDEKPAFLDAIKTYGIGEVVLCQELSEDLKMEILLLCMGLKKVVYLVPEVSEIALLNARVIHIDETPLILLDRLGLSFEQRLFKRAFDVAATLAALPLLLPFMLVVAAGVKLSSPGGVFYSQERVTHGGRVYKIYKFRTMYEGAERLTGPVLSPAGDSRVTKFGKFLRRYRIDEFPQLINVLKGDMSLVGPRSERPFFAERFSRDIEGYDIRNNVKSGLTGYAQIFGGYDTEASLKLKYDILYIKNYSLLLDIKLILQTLNAIIKKGGS